MDAPNMSTEFNAPINSSGGGSNSKFIIIVVAVVVIVGIVALAWVFADDGDDVESSPYAFPTIEPEGEFLLQLPKDIRFHLQYQDQNFFAKDFLLLENCSIQMEKWYMWEQEDSDYGYRLHNQQIFLVGPVAVYDLFAKVIDLTPGTYAETNE